jgi:hypothetical protein
LQYAKAGRSRRESQASWNQWSDHISLSVHERNQVFERR